MLTLTLSPRALPHSHVQTGWNGFRARAHPHCAVSVWSQDWRDGPHNIWYTLLTAAFFFLFDRFTSIASLERFTWFFRLRVLFRFTAMLPISLLVGVTQSLDAGMILHSGDFLYFNLSTYIRPLLSTLTLTSSTWILDVWWEDEQHSVMIMWFGSHVWEGQARLAVLKKLCVNVQWSCVC